MSAQNTSQHETRTPGWFSDPLDSGRIRFWNGQAWTNDTAVRDTAARVDLPPPTGQPHPAPTTPGPGTPPATGVAPMAANTLPASNPYTGPAPRDGLPFSASWTGTPRPLSPCWTSCSSRVWPSRFA